MRNLSTLFILLLAITFVRAQDTFSIVAVDASTGEVGSAGASCIGWPQIGIGCKIISDVHPGVGAIHTQAYWIAGNQNYGKSLMNEGYSPQQIIDSLVTNDWQNDSSIRQYGVVDFTGSAGFTGSGCDDYKNHILGPNYAIQGNILLGPQILDSIQSRFLNTTGTLACRLMSALQGAKVPGADTRCLDAGISTLSAFIRVAEPGDTLGTLTLDLNVRSVLTDYSIDPIDSLQTLFDAAVNCSNTGIIAAENSSTQIRAFPDPAHNFFVVTSPSKMKHISLSEMVSGKSVKEINVPSEISWKIFCNQLPKGVYLIRSDFEDGKKAITKVVIQ